MSLPLYSPRAEADLENIAEYTLRTWGERQTRTYVGEIRDCCGRLAASPLLGRACPAVRLGLRRFEQAKHVIFYRSRKDGVLIVRILHQRALPEKQGFSTGH